MAQRCAFACICVAHMLLLATITGHATGCSLRSESLDIAGGTYRNSGADCPVHDPSFAIDTESQYHMYAEPNFRERESQAAQLHVSPAGLRPTLRRARRFCLIDVAPMVMHGCYAVVYFPRRFRHGCMLRCRAQTRSGRQTCPFSTRRGGSSTPYPRSARSKARLASRRPRHSTLPTLVTTGLTLAALSSAAAQGTLSTRSTPASLTTARGIDGLPLGPSGGASTQRCCRRALG